MDINYTALAYKLQKYDKIFFYGTGNIARESYEGLNSLGIVLTSCVVTKKKKKHSSFMGTVPINQVDEYLVELKEENAVVLIAVSSRYEQEIERILCNYGIENYLCLSNFSLLRAYQTKSIEQIIDEIVQWNMTTNHIDWNNFDAAKKELTDKIADKKTIKNKIVFAIGNMSPRVQKIIEALHNEGKKIIIYLYSNVSSGVVFKDWLQKMGIPCNTCICVEEFIYKMIEEQAEVIHIFSGWENTAKPYALMKMKEILPSHIVYDKYDIINEFYYNPLVEMLEEERFCLEKADGVCNRGYELDYLRQQCGYHFEGKTIQLIDYCRDEDVEERCQHAEEALSLCYAGGVVTERDYPDWSIACLLELAERCAESKCHLHIYPAKWLEESFKDFIELEKENEFFHLHHPIPYELLRKELAQYDYGVLPIRASFLQREIDGYNRKEKYTYAMTNKFFDFLDAGISIVAATPVMLAKYLESEGALIRWTIEEYDFDFLRRNRERYRNAAKKLQRELQIKNHIHKLIQFYDAL